MIILLIRKSERAILNSDSGVKYHFVACMALWNVYCNYQNCFIYIALFLILYVIGYLFYLKTDCAWYKKIPVSLKKDLSNCIKFLIVIHVHLHKQNSIYLNFYIYKKYSPKF